MNAKAIKATATAVRVVACAVEREVIVDRPTCLDIYGRSLSPVEISWLLDGMPDATLSAIPDAPAGGEDMQLVGTLVGRMVRVLLAGRERPGVVGDLAQALAGRAIRAHTKAGAS